MIDLKKQIEKLLESANGFYRKTANINSKMCLQSQVEAYQDCLDILDQYNIGELSDGYHTFNSLYEQRMYLFATIVNQNKDKAWKSYKHEDGELCFGGGWFIVGIDTPNGSYTYHYENKYYDLFECEELECGKHWDGHTDKDVDRVLSLANYNIITAPKTIKLSEILDRLNKEHKKTINGNIIFEYKINRNGWYNTDGTLYHLTDTTIDSYYYGKKLLTVIKFNKNMDITVLDFGDNFKWLYTLWIAGTVIEDDLQEDE